MMRRSLNGYGSQKPPTTPQGPQGPPPGLQRRSLGPQAGAPSPQVPMGGTPGDPMATMNPQNAGVYTGQDPMQGQDLDTMLKLLLGRM
jgi:hypothetical protein